MSQIPFVYKCVYFLWSFNMYWSGFNRLKLTKREYRSTAQKRYVKSVNFLSAGIRLKTRLLIHIRWKRKVLWMFENLRGISIVSRSREWRKEFEKQVLLGKKIFRAAKFLNYIHFWIFWYAIHMWSDTNI